MSRFIRLWLFILVLSDKMISQTHKTLLYFIFLADFLNAATCKNLLCFVRQWPSSTQLLLPSPCRGGILCNIFNLMIYIYKYISHITKWLIIYHFVKVWVCFFTFEVYQAHVPGLCRCHWNHQYSNKYVMLCTKSL